jgi:capsular exopolysaccharide synthesis family protein
MTQPHNPGPDQPEDDDIESADGLNLRHYLLMVFERKWYAAAVFAVTFIAVAVYTYQLTPMYSGVVTVQILKRGAQVIRTPDIMESTVASESDFNTQIRVLESLSMAQSVEARLTPEEIKLLVGKGKNGAVESPSAVSVIFEGRRVIPQRMTLVLNIQFLHPNAKMAARVANLYASEYIAYCSRLRTDESLKAVDELKERAEQQRKRVDEMANALQAYRQRGNLLSLMQSKDIVTERLKTLSAMATQTGARLKEAEVRWNQVQEWTNSQRDLVELPFIATQSKVGQLTLQLTPQKMAVTQLRERYGPKHPRMIEAVNGLAQTVIELRAAIATAASSVKSEYENALQNDEEARKALAAQEKKSLELDKSSVEYENLNRDFRVNEQLLESMLGRMREAAVTGTIETDSARIIDRAFEPGAPVSPKIATNLAMGAVGGLGLGVLFAIFLSALNDRVRTLFDIEKIVGLPLVGVIPRVERLEQPDKAQVVANRADRPVVESFLSLYSNLRVDEISKNAKLLLITSTLPGEGKSFISTNLALTFASQGHRTAIVDCDLRKPNIQRLLRLPANKGLVEYCLEGASLDEVIAKDVQPNLDVIIVGGRAKNPIHLLNGKEFETLVAELGKRYDRVVFDTPPLGAVSDALNILPLMDGALYTIRYNTVKRNSAQASVKRLTAANRPIFGAIMNAMTAGAANTYYGESGKAYKDYYMDDRRAPAGTSTAA